MRPNFWHWKKQLCVVLFLYGTVGFAEATEDSQEQISDPALQNLERLEEPTSEERIRVEVPIDGATEARKDSPVYEPEPAGTSALTFAARIDTGYSVGGTVTQGFNLSSIRLTALGYFERRLDYRLSLGQTREFSSVLLPQVLPVEAFIRLATSPEGGIIREGVLRWKLGMFTPHFNPQWTPDLSELPVPDYATMHQELFLSRDLGTELLYSNTELGVEAAVGAFNGNGIFAPNTNNAKAFALSLAKRFSLSNDFECTVGVSSYGLFQSSPSSLNYKYRFVGNLYVQLLQKTRGWMFFADLVSGIVEDNLQTLSPKGGGMTTILPVLSELFLFSRVEYLNGVPSVGLGSRLLHAQLGPMLKLGEPLTVFALYDFSETTSRPSENTFLMRFRLVI